MDQQNSSPYRVAVIGGGPAGLMAAEVMAQDGLAVTVFDRMPSLGRKLLMAGRGGLNITHSEPIARFLTRYGEAADWMAPWLAAFPPDATRDWCAGLGQPTFVGSSGRVFPTAMKASPLLRAWIGRLQGLGVRLVTRAECTGWDAGRLAFRRRHHPCRRCGGAGPGRRFMAQVGGGWRLDRVAAGCRYRPAAPGQLRFQGRLVGTFRAALRGHAAQAHHLVMRRLTVPGELMITKDGIEGGAVYALSAPAREMIARDGGAELRVDLRPDLSAEVLTARLAGAVSESLANRLRKRAGLSPVAIGLVQEARHAGHYIVPGPPHQIPAAAPDGDRGPGARHFHSRGIRLDQLDEHLMLRRYPGVFAAGEMLDWEAPTGGYLLQACLATGLAAGRGVLAWRA